MSEQVEVMKLPPCDFCNQSNKRLDSTLPNQVDARYDGKTIYGSWANMCPEHFDLYGLGLGTGVGQRLVTP